MQQQEHGNSALTLQQRICTLAGMLLTVLSLFAGWQPPHVPAWATVLGGTSVYQAQQAVPENGFRAGVWQILMVCSVVCGLLLLVRCENGRLCIPAVAGVAAAVICLQTALTHFHPMPGPALAIAGAVLMLVSAADRLRK